MRRAGVFIGILFLSLLFAYRAAAFTDYYVDIISSTRPGYQTIVITVDTCKTSFSIKDSDFAKFSNNPDALTQMVDIAIKREEKGCN